MKRIKIAIKKGKDNLIKQFKKVKNEHLIKDYFKNNELIKSNYEFAAKIILAFFE